MSAGFSISRELHLRIGSSSLRCLLQAGLLFSLIWSLLLVWQAGHPYTASMLLPGVLVLWGRLVRDAAADVSLHWCAGVWSLERQGELIEIELLPGGSRLPWLLYIPWREVAGGRRGNLWLYSDSLEQDSLRRLRARLILER